MKRLKTKEEYAVTLLISMFKSMDKKVTLSVTPDSEDGEILEYGWVIIKGDNRILFGRYGIIPKLIEEFSTQIQEAEAMLPDFEEMTEEEKVDTINEIFLWMENPED
jgi:hypothetical protein